MAEICALFFNLFLHVLQIIIVDSAVLLDMILWYLISLCGFAVFVQRLYPS